MNEPIEKAEPQIGEAGLYTFPFWFYIDTRTPLLSCDLEKGGALIRIYPPFRSALANFMPMPEIKPEAIPFLPEARPKNPLPLIHVVTLPTFQPDGGPGTIALWSDQWGKKLNIFPMDSMRIDLINSPQGDFGLQSILHKLLERLRVRSAQWWILRSVDAFLGYERSSFSIKRNGTPIDIGHGIVKARIPFGFEKPIDKNVWRESIFDIGNEIETPPYEMLFFDAYYYLATSDIRSMVISVATGCEQAIETTFARLWEARNRGQEFKRGRVMTGYDLPTHLSRDLNRFLGRSFEQEFPTEFAEIKKLWDVRGRVAHGGKAQFICNGNLLTLDDFQAEKMLEAVRKCIDWLQQLSFDSPASLNF